MTSVTPQQLAEIQEVLFGESAMMLPSPSDYPAWFQALSEEERDAVIGQATSGYLK